MLTRGGLTLESREHCSILLIDDDVVVVQCLAAMLAPFTPVRFSDPALAHVPIIFLSGHESVELRARGFELGAVDYITKPATAAVVLARVRAQMAAKGSARA